MFIWEKDYELSHVVKHLLSTCEKIIIEEYNIAKDSDEGAGGKEAKENINAVISSTLLRMWFCVWSQDWESKKL